MFQHEDNSRGYINEFNIFEIKINSLKSLCFLVKINNKAIMGFCT